MNDVFDEDLMRELGLDAGDIAAVKQPAAAPKKTSAAAPRPSTAAQPLKPAVKPASENPAKAQSAQPSAPQTAQPDQDPPLQTKTAEAPPAKTETDMASYGEAMTQNIPVHLAAVIAKKSIALKDVIEMRTGEIIDFKKPPEEPIDLVVNGKLVAKAELVMVDGRLGARVVKLVR